jgi:hypothetical protein
VLLLSLFAGPAAAEAVAGPAATGDYVKTSSLLPGRSIRVAIRATGVLTSLNTIQAVVECDVTGLPDGQRAEISRCEVSSAAGGFARAPSLSLTGPAAATAGTGSVNLGNLTACVTASVNYGPLFPETLTISRCASGAGDVSVGAVTES